MPAFLAASPLSLAEANERLYALRRQAQAQRQALPDMPGRTESLLPEQESSAAAPLTSLPAHLGWGSAPLTALLRRQAGIKTGTASVAGSAVAGEQDWGNEGGESVNCYTKITQPSTQPVDWVKVYPDIGLAMLRQDMSAPGRLWLILRYIDKEGTGSICH